MSGASAERAERSAHVSAEAPDRGWLAAPDWDSSSLGIPHMTGRALLVSTTVVNSQLVQRAVCTADRRYCTVRLMSQHNCRANSGGSSESHTNKKQQVCTYWVVELTMVCRL